MKANSRRRVLISSLAMLLVALVALSTATYAWFTTSTKATANGIEVRTSKTSTLQISSATKGWDTNIDYDIDNKLLLPASSVDGKNWFKASAISAENGAFAENSISTVSDTSGYVIMDQLNVKNAGAVDISNVKITITGLTDANANYMRVALVEADGKGTENVTETGEFIESIYAQEATGQETYAGLKSTANTNNTTTITPANVANVADDKDAYVVEIGTLKGTETQTVAPSEVYYNLYVWFEGQDPDCVDSNAGNTVNGLTFTVTGDTVAS